MPVAGLATTACIGAVLALVAENTAFADDAIDGGVLDHERADASVDAVSDSGVADASKDAAATPDGTSTARSIATSTSIDSGVAPTSLEGEPAMLRATINGQDVGDLVVVIRSGDVAVKIVDFEKAGAHVVGGKRDKRGDDTIVWLASLVPAVAFVLDEQTLSLTITLDPSLFPRAAVDLRARRPEGIVYTSAPSMFANYAVGAYELQRSHDHPWNGFAEVGASHRGFLLYSSGQHTPQGAWLRGQSNITYDWRTKLVRMVLGDAIATSDTLGGALTMAGLSINRTFALDPYFVMVPSMQLGGTALTPSTVDVYVNGQLVRRETLAPGQFDLQNVPLTTGSGETRVVVRDAFGGERTMASPYYLALGTLAKGLSDFSYNVGIVRNHMTTASFDYGGPALLFRHRTGVTDWLTVGARIEATQHLVSAGPSAAARLPAGEVALLVAASTSNENRSALVLSDPSGTPQTFSAGPGAAALLSYSYVGRPLTIQLGATVQSDRYVNLSMNLENDRRRVDVTSLMALTLAHIAMMSLQYEGANWRDHGWIHRPMLLANRNITERWHAFVTVGSTFSNRQSTSYDTFAGLAYFVGERTTASATRSDRFGDGHLGTNHVDAQRSLPIGPGYGYRVVAEQGDNAIEEATAQVQGAHGRLEADYRRDGLDGREGGHATVTAAGGMVFIHRDLFLTRPVQDSYALVDIPGVPGVHTMLSNQVVGRTNATGRLLLPALLPYYGNRISVDDKDIPLDYTIDATEMTVAPPFRGGAVVSFPIRHVQSASGTLRVERNGTSIVPSYGRITIRVAGQSVESPIDESGAFFLENAPPGHHSAEIEFEGGTCQFELVVAPGAGALVDVGALTCIVPTEEKR